MRNFLVGALTGVLVLGAIAILVLFAGLLPVRASETPPAWETRLARRGRDASIARQAAQLANPISASDAELLAGLKLYRNNCAGCHGEGSRPSSWGSQFYPPVPQFGSEPPRKPDWQIYWILQNGLRYSGMGGWKGMMAEADMWRVSSFLSRLDSLPPAVAAAWKSPPSP